MKLSSFFLFHKVISLTIAGHFNESQEILLQTSQEDRLRPVPSSSFDMIGLETSQPPSSVETTRKNIAQYLSQQGGSASTSLSSAPVVPPDGLFSSSLTSDVDFKSPNVVAPGSEPIPFPPKVSPLPTTRNPTPYGPFPFASMTHAMNTMHGSHHSTSTLPQSSSPNRFPFSPPPPYPTSTSHSGAFQPIRPSYSPASGAVSLSSSVASGTATISTPPATTSSSLSRTCDRPNAALNSPLLVNLLQSDMSNGPSSQHLSGKALAPPPLLSDVSVGSAAGQKRKRRTGQLKKKLPTENSTTTSPSTSPLTSPSLCPFSQPFGITMPTVSSIPLSPPSLTPPSASPPSLIGQPCTSTEAMPTLKPIPFTNQPLHHGVPPLPSPPPTAPSSSASTSNNSGQSSQEAEHELSPWPSPSKRTQHLINPITGQLEPMSSEDEEDDKTSMDCSPSIDQCLNMVSDNSSSSLQSSPFVDTSRASECLLTAVQRPSAECMEGVSGDMKVTGPSSSVSKEVSSSGWSAPSPPAVVATAPSRDSPSEKIKLRLKLDPKPRIEKDKESGKPGEKPKSEGGAVTGLQYKVDVSFVNIPTRKVSSSSACSVIGFPPVTSGSSSSIVTVGCAVNSSNMPTTGTTNSGSCTIAEPRVPPLHISLRGRNAAVVTNPRREERERTRKSPESPFVKVQRSRVPRSSRTEESRTIVSGGSETGRSPPTPAGRRGAVSRGGSNSRRGRCSSYADAALPAADVGVVSSHHGTLSEGRTMVASPPSALQPSAGREKTLLSGGSFVLESTGSLAGGSVSSQPMPLTNSVADKHVTNMPTTTVVSSVHIPRLEVESGTDSSLPVENSPSSVTPETLDNSNEKALMISENHPAKITRLPSKRSSSKEWESTPSQRTLQWQALEDNLAVSDDKGVLTHSKNDPVKTSTASSQHLNSVLGHHTIAAASELNALLDKPITPPSIQFRRSSRDGSRGDDLLGSVVVKGVKVMSLSEGARAIVERRESFTRLLSGASSATKTSVALSSPPSSVTVTTVTSSSSSSLSRGFSVAAGKSDFYYSHLVIVIDVL